MRFALRISFLLVSAPCAAQMISLGNSSLGGPASQTNNPVSMVFERKQAQTLADGTHINMVSHEYFYRDSLGRTRSENEIPVIGRSGLTNTMRLVNVMDPVAGAITNWETGGPEGMVRQFNRLEMHPPQAQQQMPVTPVLHRAQPVQPISQAARAVTKTEHLGTQDVQGVPCEASRSTTVYPTDFLGNDRPITTVTERCQSGEFGRELRNLTEDPRSGTRSTTLQSVSRGEPDPSLFQPPPDYVDAKSVTH